MKTREEVESLKANWAADPCWDIEATEGFEEYRDELIAFRDLKRDAEQHNRIVTTAMRELQEVEREIYTLTVCRNALRLQINTLREAGGQLPIFDWDAARGYRMLAV